MTIERPDKQRPNLPSTLYRDASSHTYMRKWEHDQHHVLIGRTLLRTFGLTAGDTVIEMGAGFGRYTNLLRQLGLRVIACEPDPAMLAELSNRFSDDDGVTAVPLAIEALEQSDFEDIKGLCGFHVLHHLTPAMLHTLAEQLSKAFARHPDFRCWFFLEPNHYNPLYVVQTLIDPAMSFSEERGIWLTKFSDHLPVSKNDGPYIGAIGIFPPRSVLAGLPKRAVQIATSIRRTRPRPYHLYRVFGGHRSKGE